VSSVPPFQPENNLPASTTNDAAPSAGDAAGEDRRELLWENVLQQTFAAPDDSTTAVDPRTWSELQALAERHSGRPLSPEPILAEMVQIVLGPRFEQAIGSPRIMKEMLPKITKTLWDDPISHGRVQALWRKLSEGHTS
jgi:hypothetical protein